ncbi:sulfite exporter TauE/SafE family protein, partial [Gordonibacter urolithinfaciens]
PRRPPRGSPPQAPPAGETPVEAAVEQAGDAAANDDVEPDVPAGASEIAADTGKSFPKLSRKQLAIGAAIGLGAGLASGYVGVGGGFIMVPLMLSLVGISMKQASGTSLIAVMLLAIPGTIEQGLLGNIDYMAGIAVAVGSIPGAVVGARLVRLVPERTLRFIFGGFLIVAAVVLVLNEVGVL